MGNKHDDMFALVGGGGKHDDVCTGGWSQGLRETKVGTVPKNINTPKKGQVERKIKDAHKQAHDSQKLKEMRHRCKDSCHRTDSASAGKSVQLPGRGAWEFTSLASGLPGPKESNPRPRCYCLKSKLLTEIS